MSILSALKTKGAKGNNIEEAVKTLPIGGGSDNALTVILSTEDSGMTYTADKTFSEIYEALNNYIPVFGYSCGDGNIIPISFSGGYTYTDGEGVEYGNVFFSYISVFPADLYMEYREYVINIHDEVTCTLSNFTLTPQQ